MKILADENMRRDLVVALRSLGHDVVWVAEAAPETPDPQVFEMAVKADRLLLTFDKDFNEIIYRQRRRGLRGLIQVRIDIPDNAAFMRAVMASWNLVPDWDGVTTVLLPGRFRQRPLP